MRILDRISARLPAGSLGRRSLSSGAWSLAALGIGHMMRLASNLILTRLLAPEAFGLMAMVSTIQIGLIMLSDLGISQSVVRAPNAEDPTFLRTAWTVQALRGLLVTTLIVLAGLGLHAFGGDLFVAGTVYADPVLPWLIVASAVSVQIDTLTSGNLVLAHRRMDLGRVTIVTLSGQAIGICVMVGIASQWASVWALVIGNVIGSLFRMTMSHLVFPGPTMWPAWDRETRDELWRFGKWIIASSALGFFAQYADRLILGALLPTTDFSLYMIALLWVQAYSMSITSLTSQIGFSALSEVRRERPTDLPRVLRRLLRLIDVLCVTGFVMFFFFGANLITVLYNPEYHAAGALMPILAILILNQRFNIFAGLLLAEGNSFGLMLSNAASATAICLAIPLGYMAGGVAGAIAGSILAPLAGVAVKLGAAMPRLGREIWKDWAWFAGILALAALVIATVDTPGGG